MLLDEVHEQVAGFHAEPPSRRTCRGTSQAAPSQPGDLGEGFVASAEAVSFFCIKVEIRNGAGTCSRVGWGSSSY